MTTTPDEYDDWKKQAGVATKFIMDQISALRAGSGPRRRRFRRLNVVCAGCQQSLAEVIDTKPYSVLVYRGPASHPDAPEVSSDARSEDGATAARSVGASIRRSTREDIRLIPDPVPDPNSPDASMGGIIAVCGCRQIEIGDRDLFAWLRTGKQKIARPVPERG